MKSLNVHMDVAGADSGIIVEEYARTQNLKMTELSRDPVIPTVEKAQTASLGDAPLIPRLGGPARTKHLLDLIIGWKGAVDKAAIKTHAALGQYTKLLVPVAFF